MQRNVIILRGVSGSGKSTFAKLFSNSCICTADDFFYDKDGNYKFDATKLDRAHASCRDKFDDAVKDPTVDNIVIANTNTKPYDYSYYANQGKKHGMNVFFVILENRHGNINVHNVPEVSLQKQHDAIMRDIKLM